MTLPFAIVIAWTFRPLILALRFCLLLGDLQSNDSPLPAEVC